MNPSGSAIPHTPYRVFRLRKIIALNVLILVVWTHSVLEIVMSSHDVGEQDTLELENSIRSPEAFSRADINEVERGAHEPWRRRIASKEFQDARDGAPQQYDYVDGSSQRDPRHRSPGFENITLTSGRDRIARTEANSMNDSLNHGDGDVTEQYQTGSATSKLLSEGTFLEHAKDSAVYHDGIAINGEPTSFSESRHYPGKAEDDSVDDNQSMRNKEKNQETAEASENKRREKLNTSVEVSHDASPGSRKSGQTADKNFMRVVFPRFNDIFAAGRDYNDPLSLVAFLNEGAEWLVRPAVSLWGDLGHRVDALMSGLLLHTARALPNYGRNVIVSYRDYQPSMWLSMLNTRNNFLRQLAGLFVPTQPVRSIYLRNLGMEIFEVPEIWNVADFVAAALRIPAFVSDAAFDASINDFDAERQTAINERSSPSTSFDESHKVQNHNHYRNSDRGALQALNSTSISTGVHLSNYRGSSVHENESDEKENSSDTMDVHGSVETFSPVDSGTPLSKREIIFDRADVVASPRMDVRRLDVMPNDPFTWQQWSIIDSGPSRWGIEAPKAWEIWTGATAPRRAVIALIDSGVDYEHPDLRNQIWHNSDEICGNGIDDDSNGLIDDCIGWDFINGDNKPMDDNGHGTASAGIIAAEPNNGIGLTGVCWGCELMVLKALNKDIKGTVSSFARAIDYAIGKGVRISNNSYGGRGSGFRGLEEAVQRARQVGMIFVAAAGNYNGNNDNDKRPVFPASYTMDNIISVGAISRSGDLAPFSSYGKSKVHVAAPGEQIMSTSLNKAYKIVDGTSFAVPIVTGIVGLLWTHRPDLMYTQVIQRVLRSVKSNPELSGKIATSGTVDAYKALVIDGGRGTSQSTTHQQCATLNCSKQGTCQATTRGATCKCLPGFQGDGFLCEDVDECLYNPCGPASVCKNTFGSYQCKCREGFYQTENSCIDIDECLMGSTGRIPTPCPQHAICRNFSGTFDCICPAGYAWNAVSGDRAYCLKIGSPVSGPCTANGGCGYNMLCTMTQPGLSSLRTCQCIPGYHQVRMNAAYYTNQNVRSENEQICVRDGLLIEELNLYMTTVDEAYKYQQKLQRSIQQGANTLEHNQNMHQQIQNNQQQMVQRFQPEIHNQSVSERGPSTAQLQPIVYEQHSSMPNTENKTLATYGTAEEVGNSPPFNEHASDAQDYGQRGSSEKFRNHSTESQNFLLHQQQLDHRQQVRNEQPAVHEHQNMSHHAWPRSHAISTHDIVGNTLNLRPNPVSVASRGNCILGWCFL